MRLVFVRADPSLLGTAFPMVAIHTHAFGIVGLVRVWALDHLLLLDEMGTLVAWNKLNLPFVWHIGHLLSNTIPTLLLPGTIRLLQWFELGRLHLSHFELANDVLIICAICLSQGGRMLCYGGDGSLSFFLPAHTLDFVKPASD